MMSKDSNITIRPPRTSSIVAILVIGVFLRLWNLGVHSLWHDEGATLYLATAADPIEALRGSRHPPISIFAFRAWIAALGESDAAVRLLPAIVSCVSLLLFTKVARRFCDAPAAMLAIAIYSVAPFQLWYAGEVTPYAFLELGSMITLVAIPGVLRDAKWHSFVFLALGPAIAFGSQYMGWLIGATVVACASIARVRGKIHTKTAISMIAAAAAGGLLWVPWLLTIFQDQQKTVWGNEAKLGLRAMLELPARLLLIDLGDLTGPLVIVSYTAGFIISAALAVFGIHTIRARRENDLYLLAAMVAPLAGALGLLLVMPPNFLPRYLTPAAPAVACGVAVGIVTFAGGRLYWIPGAILFATLAFISTFQKLDNHREDYRSGCEEILQMWKPGDSIFVITGTPDPFAQAPARHYMKSRPAVVATILPAGPALSSDLHFTPGSRIHLLYRERIYSKDQKAFFDRIATLENQSADRHGIRRLCYLVAK